MACERHDAARRSDAGVAMGARARIGRSGRDDWHRRRGSCVSSRGNPGPRRRSALSGAAMAQTRGGCASLQPLARRGRKHGAAAGRGARPHRSRARTAADGARRGAVALAVPRRDTWRLDAALAPRSGLASRRPARYHARRCDRGTRRRRPRARRSLAKGARRIAQTGERDCARVDRFLARMAAGRRMAWERPLSSAEYQARNTWDDVLTQFAAFGWMAPRIAAATRPQRSMCWRAITCSSRNPRSHRWKSWAGSKRQGCPSTRCGSRGSPPKSAGGAAAEPASPVGVAARAHAPHASRARACLRRGPDGAMGARAPEVVFSFAVNADDHVRSDVVARSARAAFRRPEGRDDRGASVRISSRSGSDPRRSRAHRGARESCPGRHDTIAAQRLPVPGDGAVSPGDTSMAATGSGLRPIERGILVHAALAAFWRDVRDYATLVALAPDALNARIAAASEAALNEIRARAGAGFRQSCVGGEAPRIASLLRAGSRASSGRVRPSPSS